MAGASAARYASLVIDRQMALFLRASGRKWRLRNQRNPTVDKAPGVYRPRVVDLYTHGTEDASKEQMKVLCSLHCIFKDLPASAPMHSVTSIPDIPRSHPWSIWGAATIHGPAGAYS